MQPVLVTIIRNSLLLSGVLFVAFMLLQDDMGLLTAAVQHVQSGQASSPERVSSPSSETDYASSGDSQIVIEGDSMGHYFVNADIGGREIEFFVDTGASMVVLSEADAYTIGLRHPSALLFRPG